MVKIVSALKARRNLGEFINRAYYKGEETIIEKKGKPVAKITWIKTPNFSGKGPLAKTAGVWKDLNTEAIKKKIKESRRDDSSKKEFLARW